MQIYKHINCRTVLCMLMFWGQIQNYMIRVSLSLIIVEMIKDTVDKPGDVEGGLQNRTLPPDSCLNPTEEPDLPSASAAILDDPIEKTTVDQSNKLDWDSKTKGFVFAAFSWGYMTSQIIGGRLAETFGSKIVYGLGITLPGLLMLVHPAAAYFDPKMFMAVRVMLGVLQGVTWPAMHALTARWVPLEERSSFIARSYFGSTFGLIITFPMCGFIIDSLGWEACFYIICGITMVWSLAWFSLVHDTPLQHPSISEEEKELLSKIKVGKGKVQVPWTGILTSLPLLGTLLTDMANTWGIITISSYGPSYLKTMLGVSIRSNGILSGLPMLARYLGGVAFAKLCDYLIGTGRISVISARRVFNSASQVMPAILVVLIPYSGCSATAVTALKIALLFFNGAISSGHFSSVLDLAPDYAGTIFGMTNTASGGGMGSLAPIVAGYILQDDTAWSSWQALFWTAGVIYFVGNLVYVVLIKTEPQAWNYRYIDQPSNKVEGVEEDDEKESKV